MSSLIERATQRLEQLRRAGVTDVAGVPATPLVSGTLPEEAVSSSALDPQPVLPPPDTAAQSRLVTLDNDVLERSRIFTPSSPRSLLADQFRIIKRPLITNAFGPSAKNSSRPNLIMVSSAVPGEGKSFTAINLAMSVAAELDHSVMLVDADVARPSVLRMLGLPEGRGLLDVLRGEASLSDVMLRTNVEGLTLLPSGTAHAHATELIASEAMNLLLDQLASRYPDRIVIFDSPPLLLTTEARVLASHMGQILIVVQAGKTLQSEVQAALVAIEACPIKMMVLNQIQVQSEGTYGYGYGHGYGYGLGYGR